MAKPVLTDREYDYFRDILLRTAGIQLGPSKQTLVEGRLNTRLRLHGFSTFSELITLLEKDKGDELACCVDALTTNTTQFFREPQHFDRLKEIVNGELFKRKTRLNVWCAACSTGEEVYTLGMVLEGLRDSRPEFDYRILATDIADTVLRMTDRGVYTEREMKGLSSQQINRFFQVNRDRNRYRVKPVLRDKVKVRRHNLADVRQSVPMVFDIIFLRNVLIYFPPEIIEVAAKKMHSAMEQGSYLFIGHSDSLGAQASLFEGVAGSVLKRVD